MFNNLNYIGNKYASVLTFTALYTATGFEVHVENDSFFDNGNIVVLFVSDLPDKLKLIINLLYSCRNCFDRKS